MAEFTGERIIPGQVDADLMNEHLARYAFASRLARGKRVLDIGCGAGYGSAELAAAALSVTGMDVAREAVEFAREHYTLPNLRFELASAAALPHPDASFDLVVAFEVIEHLGEWRAFLDEVRRVLVPKGQFIVSTPNKLYYAETRRRTGPNPYHVHEFEFAEFRDALAALFPHISLFVENHVEGVVFQPVDGGAPAEVRVESGEACPEESHFFVAVCAHRPQIGNPTFVYLPRAANLLREREQHIELLESEIRAKDEWLAALKQEHQDLVALHRAQTEELEQRNHWAAELDARIRELGDELAREQENARALVAGYEQKIADLERDIREKTEWALETERRLGNELQEKCQELGRAVELLHQSEALVVERTEWALKLQAEAAELAKLLSMYRASRWVRFGRRLNFGPRLPES